MPRHLAPLLPAYPSLPDLLVAGIPAISICVWNKHQVGPARAYRDRFIRSIHARGIDVAIVVTRDRRVRSGKNFQGRVAIRHHFA